ncbi:MAG: hypothetical protein ABR589_02290 [Chthoniobacterales bacterium]
MEQTIFIIIVVIVGLLRLIAAAAENKKNADAAKRAPTPASQTRAPAQPAPAGSEEERIRKFLEALGVPNAGSPPPQVQPRQIAPKAAPEKRKIFPVDPFPKPRAGGGLPPLAPPPPVVHAPVAPTPFAPPPLPLPTRETTLLTDARPAQASAVRGAAEFEVRDIDAVVAEDVSLPRPQKPPSSVVARLAAPDGLRDAIVLREIFGLPRSMQPLDLATL